MKRENEKRASEREARKGTESKMLKRLISLVKENRWPSDMKFDMTYRW